MINEAQIRDQLLRYLARQITLNEFEDWIVLQSWNMHQDADAAAQRLVGAIELRLAEYSDDHLTDEALERELKGLIASSAVVSIITSLKASTLLSWTSGTASESFLVKVPASQAA